MDFGHIIIFFQISYLYERNKNHTIIDDYDRKDEKHENIQGI